MLEDGAECEDGEEGERTDDDYDPSEQRGEEWGGDGEGSGGGGNALLCCQIAGDGEHGDEHEEAADEHGDSERGVVPVGVGVEAGEG